MGGRGGSSGFSTSKETYKFSVSNLTGSEKQKAWAQRIVDDALGTINTNIKNFTVGMQKNNPNAKTIAEGYKTARDGIMQTLKNVKSASQIIDNRSGISGQRIIRWVNEYEQRKRKKK